MSAPSVSLTVTALRLGVCSYNNIESNHAERRHIVSSNRCLCIDGFPLSDEYDEPEYRLALKTRGSVEIFGFLCEQGMLPRPLYDNFKIRMPSQLIEIIQPAKRLVEAVAGVKLLELESIKHKSQISDAFNFLKDKLGPVCSAKVLHLLGPELFVPWDNEIRDSFQLNIYDQDYFKFLETCRKELFDLVKDSNIKSEEIPALFYQNGWKPLTKLLDEYHEATVKKLAPHFSTQ